MPPGKECYDAGYWLGSVLFGGGEVSSSSLAPEVGRALLRRIRRPREWLGGDD